MTLDASSDLPPLPEIKSDSIRQQIFTHRSLHARPADVFEDPPDDPSPDNEKLEHLGDAVLGMFVSLLIQTEFPLLRVGPSTKLKALIIGNAHLASLSVKYKLPNRLRLDSSQALKLRASPNVQADLFEAFVGGLYLDQGHDKVKEWLFALLRSVVLDKYYKVRDEHLLPQTTPTIESTNRDPIVGTPTTFATVAHLDLFNAHIQNGKRKVEWNFVGGNQVNDPQTFAEFGINIQDIQDGMRNTPLWLVTVKVDGEKCGRGKGSSKKAAQREAAKMGLETLGLLCNWSVSPITLVSASFNFVVRSS